MSNTEELIASLSEAANPVSLSPYPLVLFIRWLAVSATYVVILLVCSGLREDVLLKMHSALFLAETGALVAIIVTTGLSAAALSFPDLHQKRWIIYTPVMPVLVFLLVLALAWLQDSPPAPKPPHGIECLLCITLFSLLPTAWLLYILRRQASTHYRLAGSIALLAASGIGCLALRLSEKTDSISHLVEWHYLPMVGFGILGLWLGKQFLKW